MLNPNSNFIFIIIYSLYGCIISDIYYLHKMAHDLIPSLRYILILQHTNYLYIINHYKYIYLVIRI